MKSEQDLDVESNHSIDKTVDQMKACTRSQTPMCLDSAMGKMFGQDNKNILRRIAERVGYEQSSVSSPRDVWKMYFDLMQSWAKAMGKDVSEVLEFQSLKEMKQMSCNTCPLYEIEQNKLGKKSVRERSDTNSE